MVSSGWLGIGNGLVGSLIMVLLAVAHGFIGSGSSFIWSWQGSCWKLAKNDFFGNWQWSCRRLAKEELAKVVGSLQWSFWELPMFWLRVGIGRMGSWQCSCMELAMVLLGVGIGHWESEK
jgi:hypothetical protein